MKSLIFNTVILADLLLLLVSCSGPAPEKVTAEAAGTVAVAVAQVTREDLARDLELAAEFRPNQEVDLHAKLSGYLKEVFVDVGDRVRQGQLIARLEVPEMAQELEQASSALKRAELDVERAKGEVRRVQAAYNIRELSYNRLSGVMKARPNLIAQQEIDDSSARFSEADAQLGTAQAALAAIEQQVQVARAYKERITTMIGYLRITAPFSGVVTERLVDPGAMIQAGTASQSQAKPVIRLSQIDHLRLVLPVPEGIAARIRTGDPVEVRVDALNRVFQGRVSRFSGKLESSTRTMETEVDIPNPDFALMPGMYGYATLRLDRKNDAIAVPIQAVSGHDATPLVMVVNDQKAIEERRVTLGMETPNMVEVLSGLRENEFVVIGKRTQLKAGMNVEPKLVEPLALDRRH